MLRRLLLGFVAWTKPAVRSVALLYDIRVTYPWTAQGQHPLLMKGEPAGIRNNVPKSVYFNTRSGSITVGEGTVFGEDVQVLTGKHYNISEAEAIDSRLNEVPSSGRDIVIGRGCYIGGGAIIIGPVTVGDFAVIGAGSVVTKDVPERSFVGGPAARVLRSL
jgi:acetyltransferase-like isoleucine patch superfamily enzyme